MGYDFVRAGEELGYKNVDLNGAPFTEGYLHRVLKQF